jgi:anti-sigma factor RsiW
MNHPESERWSDYVDGDLSPADRRDFDLHLASCPACTALVEDIRRVVARAGALEDRPPRQDLWPAVSAKVRLERRRYAFTVPQLLAAALAVMLLSAGGVAFLLRTTGGRPGPEAPATPDARVVAIAAVPGDGYTEAIGRLQQQLARGRGSLDTATVRVIEAKLAVIDQAILDAERAVRADPGSDYLQAHLARARMTKLDLLRRATELTKTIS